MISSIVINLLVYWTRSQDFEKRLNFVVSVCPSAWKISVPTGRIFMKFGILVLFETVTIKFKFD